MQVLFFKIHIYLDLPQHSGDPDAVEGVSCKPADGFDDNHIYPASLALADQLIELIPLFHTGAGNALVGINAYELPSSFPVDAVGVVIYLIFVAVELFILLG